LTRFCKIARFGQKYLDYTAVRQASVGHKNMISVETETLQGLCTRNK